MIPPNDERRSRMSQAELPDSRRPRSVDETDGVLVGGWHDRTQRSGDLRQKRLDAPSTPYRRRRVSALRKPPLPGMTRSGLRGRDPLAAVAHDLVLEVERGTATVVGLPRTHARALVTDSGVTRQMLDPAGLVTFPARDVDLVLARCGRPGTVVVRVIANLPEAVR